MKFDVIILGGGASGLMCALTAGKRGRKCLVLEGKERVGEKILASGGGKCNFTNLNVSEENYVSENSSFVKDVLSSYGPSAFLEFLKKHNIGYFEKEKGQLFCRGSSKVLLSILKKDVISHGAVIKTNCRIESVEKDKNFHVKTSLGEFESKSVVVATGGLSYPNLGATEIGYKIAKKFGHKVTKLHPGLVFLMLNENDAKKFGALSGISATVQIETMGKKFEGEMLFTHRGLSGPVILDLSLFWKDGEPLHIDFADKTALSRRLKNLLKEVEVPLKLIPKSRGGYDKAEVTLGGVRTNEINPKTMESNLVPGLYFIGEVLDVTGLLGGYNLHWAWASGTSAGRSV